MVVPTSPSRAFEKLDAKDLMELDGNSRNRASAAWGTFGRMLAYKCERESTHFAAVEPANTTMSVPSAASRRTNHSGYANTRVRRVVLSATVMRTPPLISFHADLTK